MSPVDKTKKCRGMRRSKSDTAVVGGSASLLPTRSDCLKEAVDQVFGNDEDRSPDVPGDQIIINCSGKPQESDDEFDDQYMDEFDLAEHESADPDMTVDPVSPLLGTQECVISIPEKYMGAWQQACDEAVENKKKADAEAEVAKNRAMDQVRSQLTDDADSIHERSLRDSMVRHDFSETESQSQEQLQQQQQQLSVRDGPPTIEIPEMILQHGEVYRTFVIEDGALQFVLVARDREDEPWYIPDIQTFADIINLAQTRIFDEDWKFAGVVLDTMNWGGVGVLSLQATCPVRLARWRTLLTTVSHKNAEYNSFPKESLQSRSNQISLLLRDGLRYYQLKYLPRGLLTRNPLKGKVKVVFSKVYGIKEKTRMGASKYGWRLVIADVDEVFVASLSKFPPGYAFKLGASSVQIRLLNSNVEPVIPPASAAPKGGAGGRTIQSQCQPQQLQH